MSDTQATLEARLRETPLAERLSESTSRIGKMCSEGRCPAMSIPVRETDDDFYISTTIRDAASALAQSQARVAALEAALRELVEAGDHCVYAADDMEAMLRFGKADKAARAALSAGSLDERRGE